MKRDKETIKRLRECLDLLLTSADMVTGSAPAERNMRALDEQCDNARRVLSETRDAASIDALARRGYETFWRAGYLDWEKVPADVKAHWRDVAEAIAEAAND